MSSVALSSIFFMSDFDNSLLRFFWDDLEIPAFSVMFNIHGMPPIDFVMLGLLGVIFSIKFALSTMIVRVTKFLSSYIIQ